MHWDFAVLLDAVEVLHGLGGRLAEQGEGHEQLARPTGILLVLGGLVVLQGLVKHVLELLHRLHVLDVHGVCEHTADETNLDRGNSSCANTDTNNQSKVPKPIKSPSRERVNWNIPIQFIQKEMSLFSRELVYSDHYSKWPPCTRPLGSCLPGLAKLISCDAFPL